MEGTNIEELFNILADKYLSDIAGIIKADGDDGKITIKLKFVQISSHVGG